MASTQIEPEELRRRADSLPGMEHLRGSLAGLGAHLVGGAVRDLALGADRTDIDIVLEGDAIAAAERLGEDVVAHERFGTATVRLGGHTVDLATARAESYPSPGALPEVRPGSLRDDLRRRDFTVNAMALPLEGPARLVDPYGGAEDLESRLLRVLHHGSFVDDPTRALRAARYAARLEFALEGETETLLRRADLSTVSRERVEAELRRLGAEEAAAARGLELAAGWGLLDLDEELLRLARDAAALVSEPPWREVCPRPDAMVTIVRGDLDVARALASIAPPGPADGVDAAHGHDGVTLALARAMDARWLDDYVKTWRETRLEIDGGDLLAAGVEEGPAVGRGLRSALRAKLEGEAAGPDEELRVALEAAKQA